MKFLFWLSIIFVAVGCQATTANKTPGLNSFNMSVAEGRLRIDFVTTALQFDTGLSFGIPKLPDSSFGEFPDTSSSGIDFFVDVSLLALFQQAYPNSTTAGLPGGAPIPDVVSGVLPSAQQKIGNTEVTFYLSDDVFGFFVPMAIPVDLPEAVSTDINDPHGNRVGRVYAIPQDGGTTQSGILVLIPYISPQPQPSPGL